MRIIGGGPRCGGVRCDGSVACGRLGRRWRGGEHVGGDRQPEAHYFILVVDGGVAEEGLQEHILVFGHLAARAGIGERHGTGHFSGFEQKRYLHGVFHRITFGVESDTEIVAIGLAREGDVLDAARELLELRRVVKIGVEAGW